MDELSPQAEAKNMQLAATRGFVPGESPSNVPVRQALPSGGQSLLKCLAGAGIGVI